MMDEAEEQNLVDYRLESLHMVLNGKVMRCIFYAETQLSQSNCGISKFNLANMVLDYIKNSVKNSLHDDETNGITFTCQRNDVI
jgi:hypothetical protein